MTAKAQVSDDGRWYFDGRGWQPVPGVVTPAAQPAQPAQAGTDTLDAPPRPEHGPEHETDLRRRSASDPVAVLGQATEIDARHVDAALARRRDQAIVATFLGALLALLAVYPQVLAALVDFTGARDVAREHLGERASWLPGPTGEALTTLAPPYLIAVSASLLALAALRRLRRVRLFWRPINQAVISIGLVVLAINAWSVMS